MQIKEITLFCSPSFRLFHIFVIYDNKGIIISNSNVSKRRRQLTPSFEKEIEIQHHGIFCNIFIELLELRPIRAMPLNLLVVSVVAFIALLKNSSEVKTFLLGKWPLQQFYTNV